MNQILIILGSLLGCIISYFAINKFVFYTKEEVDEQIKQLKDSSDTKDQNINDKLEKNHDQIKKELVETKEKIFEKLLEAERESNRSRQDLYDRLSQNKELLEQYNKTMISTLAEIRHEGKQQANEFTQILNVVKDELRNDYTNRYNDLIKMMTTKANLDDFSRLENKFDKMTETITELKTIVTLQMEENSKRK